MPSMLERASIAKRICPVIFIIDTSGSMSVDNGSGQNPIGAVNAALENSLPELISMNKTNADNQIKVSVLSFDSEVRWITGETNLVDPEDLKSNWKDLNANGLTLMGTAFKALNQKLSLSHGFMQHASGSCAPVLFLLSDGEPTDDYKSGLRVLQENVWYKAAVKAAIGYGESNDDILREFTGCEGTVMHTDNPKELAGLIKYVTITSSKVASNRTNTISPQSNPQNANPNDIDGNTQKLADALKQQQNIMQNVDIDDQV